MPAKFFAAILTFLILLPGAVAAGSLTAEIPIMDWHWINTFTAYDPTGKAPLFRSWGSLQGVAKFKVHNGRFEVIIGEAKDGTDTLVKGRIRGHQVTATAVRVQTKRLAGLHSHARGDFVLHTESGKYWET